METVLTSPGLEFSLIFFLRLILLIFALWFAISFVSQSQSICGNIPSSDKNLKPFGDGSLLLREVEGINYESDALRTICSEDRKDENEFPFSQMLRHQHGSKVEHCSIHLWYV